MHIVSMRKKINGYKSFVGKFGKNTSHARSRLICEINIRTDRTQTGCEYVDCINLTQNRDRLMALLIVVKNLRAP